MKLLSSLNEYYVYSLIDPRSDTIFYIGKGKGNRAEQHFKETLIESQGNHSKILIINELKENNLIPKIKYFIKEINEEAALYLEEILIERIGRKVLNYGPLTNLLVGGVKENKLKLFLLDEEKISVELAVNKYPFLKDVIESIPRTTHEDSIKKNFENVINDVTNYILSIDIELFNDLKVEKINFLSHSWKKSIQFDCKFGKCEIAIKSEKEITDDCISSIIIRKEGEIVFNSEFYSPILDSLSQLRQYVENE